MLHILWCPRYKEQITLESSTCLTCLYYYESLEKDYYDNSIEMCLYDLEISFIEFLCLLDRLQTGL
jgi:hypothetical protein